jgi:hypothetical protein
MPTPPNMNSAPNPEHAHNDRITQIAAKFANVPIEVASKELTKPDAAKTAFAPEVSVEVSEAGTPLKMSLEPEPEAPAEPVTDEPAPDPAPAPSKAEDKLRKSAEIQRRAKEASIRARQGFDRLRAKPAPQAPRGDQPTAEAQAMQQEKANLAQIRNQLDREVQLAKTDPLGFARRHGVDGAAIAKFVRDGTDPNTLKIEDLERRAAAKIKEVESRFEQRLSSIQDAYAQSKEQEVHHNFNEFVADAKAANPDSFQAIDHLYTEQEVWVKANQILENDADLRNNFDEDRLLEAVEAEARTDPRWAKVEKLIKKSPSVPQSHDQSKVKSNARVKEETPAQAPRVQRQSPPRDRSPDGQFARTSPQERHDRHLESVITRLRFGG